MKSYWILALVENQEQVLERCLLLGEHTMTDVEPFGQTITDEQGYTLRNFIFCDYEEYKAFSELFTEMINYDL